jgi:hypothetical protein
LLSVAGTFIFCATIDSAHLLGCIQIFLAMAAQAAQAFHRFLRLLCLRASADVCECCRSTTSPPQDQIVHMLLLCMQKWVMGSITCFSIDLENIKVGAYKLPWDMTTPGHRQHNPIWVARQTQRFSEEVMGILGRSRSADRERFSERLPFAQSNMYPS